jgi:meso-butanediol dehydrogenase / (S,S)-butanediol dehydrogenase / diacetyl reductase
VKESDMSELEGRAALVTGASGGIGAAVARRLHEAGARVALLSRRGDDLGLEGALGIAGDVTDRAAVLEATERAAGELGGLDVVVANAGVGAYAPFLDLPAEDVEAMIDTNLKGVIYTAAATLPHLVDGGGGDFVSVASVAGVNAFPNEAVYNASKFGQVGFVRALDLEFREKGVRCSSICPGGVYTEFALGSGREEGDANLEGMMSADDVAEFVMFTLTRPRDLRLMTVTFRPMSEASWG